MPDEQLELPLAAQSQPSAFEQIKLDNAHGAEYWSARDLQELLGCNHWRNFEKAIVKAVTSCEKSGNNAAHHFARAK
jgi:DNA-damage-inducible protein D